MGTRSSTEIDKHVGARIRLRRMLLGISQERLGDTLGVTFQQVQKYERGANRVSASKLYEIATKLGVPVSHFFDDLPAIGATPAASRPSVAETDEAETLEFVRSVEGLALNRAFAKMPPELRRRVLELVRAMAKSES